MSLAIINRFNDLYIFTLAEDFPRFKHYPCLFRVFLKFAIIVSNIADDPARFIKICRIIARNSVNLARSFAIIDMSYCCNKKYHVRAYHV